VRLTGLLVLLAGCTELGSSPRFELPDTRPLEISVSSEPAPAADGVVRDATLRATFDDYLDPDTVFFGPVVLKSGRGNFDADLRIDFVGRALLVTPRAPLLAHTTYELVIGPTVAALSGRTTGSQRVFSFDVGDTIAGPQPPRPRVTWFNPDPALAMSELIGGCAPWCHTNIGCSRRMRQPTRQLDVTKPDDPTFGMINVASVGMRGLARPMLRVAPHDPARSQLLRKLIGGNAVRDTSDPPYPDVQVDGRRMPIPIEEPCQEHPFRYFSENELRLVQEWIDGGALLN
jgi:hypothetical protein